MGIKSNVLRKVIAVSMVAAMITGTAFCVPAVSEFAGTNITVSAVETYGDFEYTVSDDNTVTVTNYKGSSAKVTVPEKINSKTVTAIGADSFKNNTGITNVTLPKTIKEIKSYAFYGCSNLTAVNVPDSVESIGECALSKCTKLTSFNYPKSLNSAGAHIFSDTPVKTVTVPEEVTKIPGYIFYGANMLEKVILPDAVTSIGINAFRYCGKLTSINLPDTVETIGDMAFGKCGLTSINFPKKIESMGQDVFRDTPIKTIKVKEGVTALPNNAFRGANKLENVVLPTTLQTIGAYSFYECTAMKKVTIPDSTESIGNHAFKNCSAMTEVVMNDSLKKIGEGAFENCSVLVNIEVPDTVTSMGSYAFANCKKLTTFNYPKKITSSGSNVFKNVPVKTIKLKSSVTEIPDKAFEGANLLEKVVLPSGLKKIGSDAFYGCSSLTSINVPDSVEGIGSYAFTNCEKLTSINYPKNLTYSGGYVFKNTGIKTITVKDGVTDITADAFNNANNLEKVVLPGTIKTIGSGAFYNCYSLKSVNVPDSVEKIGSYAFANCGNLISINYPSSLTWIDSYVFQNVPIACITVKEGVTVIPSGAFYYANKVQKVSLPSTVKKIENYAFYNCKSLEIVKVGANIENIDKQSFSGCDKLTIYGKADTYTSTYAENNGIPYVSEYSNLSIIAPNDKVSDSQKFKIIADASGGKEPYTYAVYYKQASEDKWTTLQNFKSNSQVTFDSPYMGHYDVCVKSKDAKGVVKAKYFTVSAERILKNKSTLSASQILEGESFTVNAKATGGYGGYKYAILYKKSSSSTWDTKQNYSSNNKLTIKPSAAGTYNVCVKVKDDDGEIVKTTLNITVKKPLANTSTISAEEIYLGNSVTLTGKATGGIGSYTYSMLYKKTSDTKWTTKQDFKANSKVDIKPANATTYDVCVKVKDASGTVEKKFFKLTVTKPLTNDSTISATSIKKGSTVTLKGAASGGAGSYTYAVLYKKKSETKWTVKQDYSTNTTVSVKPYLATDYDICIKVKDKDGTIVKKFFAVKVSAT